MIQIYVRDEPGQWNVKVKVKHLEKTERLIKEVHDNWEFITDRDQFDLDSWGEPTVIRLRDRAWVFLNRRPF